MSMTPDVVSLEDLHRQAVDALRRYPHEQDSAATNCLRTVASTFVSAREHFFTRTGATDWLGQTGAYRSWIREVIRDAHLDPVQVPAIQNAIRYHVGNVLRDRLDPETLESLGLRTLGPRERSAEKRMGTSTLLSLFGAGSRITDPSAMLVACRAIETSLRRWDLSGVAESEAKLVRHALAGIQRAIQAIITATP